MELSTRLLGDGTMPISYVGSKTPFARLVAGKQCHLQYSMISREGCMRTMIIPINVEL